LPSGCVRRGDPGNGNFINVITDSDSESEVRTDPEPRLSKVDQLRPNIARIVYRMECVARRNSIRDQKLKAAIELERRKRNPYIYR
jgi:hypothetical protein